MSYPINYAFVTVKKLVLADSSDVSVLALDTEANDKYWKKIESFRSTIAEMTEEDVKVGPRSWRFNKAFLDMAVQDLVNEEMTGDYPIPKILGINIVPIETGSEEPICYLELKNDKQILNNFW